MSKGEYDTKHYSIDFFSSGFGIRNRPLPQKVALIFTDLIFNSEWHCPNVLQKGCKASIVELIIRIITDLTDPQKSRSSDSGGYVKLTPKYIA